MSPATIKGATISSRSSGPATALSVPIRYSDEEAVTALRMIATRRRLGTASLSNSSHFPLTVPSKGVNPVALPPGRERLSTRPPPTGSATCTKTIGMVRVLERRAARTGGVDATITSGATATSSTA